MSILLVLKGRRSRKPERMLLYLLLVFLTTLGVPYESSALEVLEISGIESILRDTSGSLPYIPASDRETWMQIRRQLGMEAVGNCLAEAAEVAEEPLPVLPASLYLQVERTGERAPYERMVWDRTNRLAVLTLAECLENERRFVDPLLDLGWAICEQSTWVLPAHRDGLPDPTSDTIDLFSAIMGMELGITVKLLEDRLDPRLVRRIKYEADRRLFARYLEDDFGWRRTKSNWNAVCNGSVMTAALLLEDDQERLARILASGLESLQRFLAGFGTRGGTSEGVSYWQFGFGHYALIGHMLEERTEGKIDLFADPKVKEIALFPLRCEMSPGRYTTFSDASSGPLSVSWLPYFLAERLHLPSLRALADRNPFPDRRGRSGDLTYAPLGWVEFPPRPPSVQPYHQELRHFFPDLQWLICRADPDDPEGFVLAAKAGHNAEMHNHNDVGSFVVHLNGESILTDPGAGVYTKQYFSRQRYNFFATSSRGHPVPVVNGQYQRSGADARGVILDRAESDAVDTLVMDLTAAYPPEAGIGGKLVRSFRFSREGRGRVDVTDEVLFKGGAGTIESVLITKGEASQVRPGLLRIDGERARIEVEIEPGDAEVTIDRKSASELRMRDRKGLITRIGAAVTAKGGDEPTRIRFVVRPAL